MTLIAGGGISMSFGSKTCYSYQNYLVDGMVVWFSLYGQLFLLYNRHSLTSPRDDTETITNMLV